MQTITLTDDGLMIGTRVFRFASKRTAILAVTEFAAAHFQGGDAMAKLETIAGNEHGAEVSGK